MTIDKLNEILLSDKPSILLKANEEELFKLIPELKRCKGFDQKNPWHIYDIYEHILHVVDEIEPLLNLRMAALFHDVGKPDVFSLDEKGVGHFYYHNIASVNIFKKFAIKNNLDYDFVKDVSNIIVFHDLHVQDMAASKIASKFSKDDLINLFKIKRADLLAQNPDKHTLFNIYDEKEKESLELIEKQKKH